MSDNDLAYLTLMLVGAAMWLLGYVLKKREEIKHQNDIRSALVEGGDPT